MSEVRVIQVNESIFAENDRSAELIRKRLTAQGTLFLNFMSSPGSGKTTTLVALINRLKGSLNIGEPADLTVLDLEKNHTINTSKFRSRGQNCPYNGWECTGAVHSTFLAGKHIGGRRVARPSTAWQK